MKARAGKKRSHEPYSSYGEAPVQNAQHKVDDGARPLRVLFIDNIANNAYLNAKALRRHGVEVDVYVGGYYHIMACPEWEEGGFTNFAGTHNQPDWTRTVGLNYVRPDWVIQMREPFGLRYLLAKTEGRRWAARFWWKVGNLDRKSIAAMAAWASGCAVAWWEDTSLFARERPPHANCTAWAGCACGWDID